MSQLTIGTSVDRQSFQGGTHANRIVVVGSDSFAESVAAVLHEWSALGASHRGFTPIAQIVRIESPDDLMSDGLADAPRIHSARPVEAVDAVSRLLQRVPLQLLSVEPRIADALVKPQNRTTYAVAKRSLDIAATVLLGLVALLLLPVIAVAIRIDSPGPVFYRQTRVGRYGRHFQIHKFRTMRRDAEAHGAVYAALNDARITRVGRLLRRTRTDELPQLWNILRGEMSLIGPRPERPENVALLEEHLPGFAIRTRMRPGLTGWAQVCYRYAGTIEQTGKKLEYDLYYVKNASLAFDVKILMRTVKVVFGFQGQ
ncbi:MAG: sugar transferase [Thermomicrobiales bacterium]